MFSVPLRMRDVVSAWMPPVPAVAGDFLGHLLAVDRLLAVYEDARRQPARSLAASMIERMGVRIEVDPRDLERVPRSGAVLAVANHPFGILDGAALLALLLQVRPDVRILANRLLAAAPELREHCIFVDPFERRTSGLANSRGLKEAMRWLQQGGMLATFPAGEVSRWNVLRRRTEDPAWRDGTALLLRRSGAAAVPVYFAGANSAPFHLAGMIHPALQTARLPREFLNKRGMAVSVRIGTVVHPRKITRIPNAAELTRYLRWRTYLLADRGGAERRTIARRQRALASPIPAVELAQELESLPAERIVEESAEWRVALCPASMIPRSLQEIGRLRELTFRAVGEGTGREADLDGFDDHYEHLVLWHRPERRIVGAYRIGRTDAILAARGIHGLYTNTLFRYQREFFSLLGPAIELGRSFIRPEYQKQYAPLMMLWKGMLAEIARKPGTPVLFGAVSISNEYCEASRRMVTEFFRTHGRESDLAKLVRPRRPFPLRRDPLHEEMLRDCVADLDELSESVSEIEADGKGVPVLLRQYMRLGGRLLGFHVDRGFGDTLDGLMVVDLRQTPRTLLDRYMGKAGAAAFLRHHGAELPPEAAAAR